MTLARALKHFQKNKHRDFSRLAERHGRLQFEPRRLRTPFESLVRAISHQQLHANAAEAILGRLIVHFSPKPFPEPEDLMRLEEIKFREFGFSGAKTKSLKDIAAKTLEGVVPAAAEIASLADEEIVERLTRIHGVGRWTVEMLLIFQLGRMNVWPIDDFGVQTGYRIFKRRKERPDKKRLFLYGEEWHPYRTVAALYLWQEANAAKKLKKKPKLKKKEVKRARNSKVGRSRTRPSRMAR